MKKMLHPIILGMLIFALGCGSQNKEDEEALDPAPGDNEEQETPNTAPTVQGGHFLVKQGEALALVPQAEDADGDSLTMILETAPQHGTLSQGEDGFSYEAEAGYVGVDQFSYRASDSKTVSEPAIVQILVISGQIESGFWLRPEDIQTSGTDGDIITDWKDAISGTSARFKGEERTPRFISNLVSGVKGVLFEFATGAGATNDFMYYPETYVYSASEGMTMLVVGEAVSFPSSIAPVVSFGDWITEGFGLSWNTTTAGVATSTQHGGFDTKGILQVAGGGLSILTSQIRFSSPAQNNGFQRVRFNSGSWANSDTTLGLTQLTAQEIAEKPDPVRQGSPIVVGANNDWEFQPDRRFSGRLGEVILLNRFLSNTELNVVENYLKAKFQIQ